MQRSLTTPPATYTGFSVESHCQFLISEKDVLSLPLAESVLPRKKWPKWTNFPKPTILFVPGLLVISVSKVKDWQSAASSKTYIAYTPFIHKAHGSCSFVGSFGNNGRQEAGRGARKLNQASFTVNGPAARRWFIFNSRCMRFRCEVNQHHGDSSSLVRWLGLLCVQSKLVTANALYASCASYHEFPRSFRGFAHYLLQSGIR